MFHMCLQLELLACKDASVAPATDTEPAQFGPDAEGGKPGLEDGKKVQKAVYSTAA